MIIDLRAWCGALALATLVPAVAAAQPPRNPFAELFGRAPDRTGREYTAVQFRSTAGSQFGQTLENEFQPPGQAIPEGISAGADASVTAQYMRDRVQLVASGRYAYQEYRQAPAFGVPAFEAGAQGDFKPTARLAVHGGGHFARSPFFQLVWLAPGPGLASVDSSAILLMRNDTADVSAGVTASYTKRSSIDVTAQARRTRFELVPEQDFSSIGGRARWNRRMSRDLIVHVGYGREEFRQQSAEGDSVFTSELLDIGVDYSRSFSLARRMSLSFTTDTSMMRENGGARHFRVNGGVLLDRRFLRSWVAQLSARRATEFLPGFRAPVFTESAQALLAGYLAKRLLVGVSASGGQGEAGFNDPRKYISYGASSKLTIAMTRHLGVFTQYAYTHYQSPPDPLTLFLLPRGARQSVAIGIETWFPIYEKEKVPSDPR